MAVRLRLKRTGKKKQPSYRVVAVESRKPRDGRVLEVIGTYDPRAEPSAISIVNERAVHWLSHGAQPSDTVAKLLTISGAWDQFRSQRVPTPAIESTEATEATEAVVEPAPTPDLVLDSHPAQPEQLAQPEQSATSAAGADESASPEPQEAP